MPQSAPNRWTAGVGRQLHWRHYDHANDPAAAAADAPAESVVYDPASGDTHVLDPVSAAVLHLLEQQPFAAPQLVERIAAQLDLQPSADLVRHIEQVLARFDELGLIEPAGDTSINPSTNFP